MNIKGRQLWRFDIYAIHTERGENPEDLYYLCNVRDDWFVIFETDYVHSLEDAAKEAAEKFEFDGAKITHWLTTKDPEGQPGTLPLEAAKDKDQWDKLIIEVENSYLRCAVLAIETKGRKKQRRYDPTTYGYSTT